MNQRSISIALIVPAVIVALIFIVMQFVPAINWDILDFVIAYLLLESLSVGLLFIVTRIKSRPIQIILGLGAILVFGLIWAQLAVGIFN